MKKVDRTKENIKVDNLNPATRKNLLNKFMEAGGKIISEYETHEQNIKEKNKKLKPEYDPDRKKTSDKKFNIIEKTEKEINKKRINKSKSIPENKNSILISFSNKLIIRFRLFFMNVTDFSGKHFNNKFFHLFNTEYKPALLDIQLLYLEIFKNKKDIANQIIVYLDRINPINSQLIDQISAIYDEIEITELANNYNNSPIEIYPIETIREPVLTLFRKLYFLKSYEQNIFTAFNKAILLYMKLSNKKSFDHKIKRKKLKDDLYLIFGKLFPALYWLFCKYQNNIMTIGSIDIEKSLKINAIMQKNAAINKYMPEENNEEHEIDKMQAEDETNLSEKPQTELSNDLKLGINLLSIFNINYIKQLRELYDKHKTFSNVKDNDKILFLYMIFQEFDAEYSFLLTTNKVTTQL